LNPTTFLLLLFFTLFLIVFVYKSKQANKLITDRTESLPEVIELIISGLQAGMSISETLANLSKIGPNCINEVFAIFENHLRNGGNFEDEINRIKNEFKDPLADQLFETLIYANKFGGRNAVKILHELAEFVANDLSLRAEISARFGWVKNSASLAAAAPWLLYLILRTQENAKIAYSQPFGQTLMILGFVLTVIAYFWMQKIATLPKAKRVFIRNQSTEFVK
jgi:tight adherence protein B